MIQELLGGSRNVNLIGGHNSKFSTPTCDGILNGSLSNSPSPAASSPCATATAATSENLKCPRCDSPNTKFCYYNNYNLTQPRHFCKTCRRYWTKGGALRNVPIGGGCRKNKGSTMGTAGVIGRSNSLAGKLKSTMLTPEIGKSGIFSGCDFHAEVLSANPVIWGTSSQNSHFLSLIRGNPNPNPIQIPNTISVKDEGILFRTSNLSSESSIADAGGMNTRVLGWDPPGQQLHGNQGTQGTVHGEVQNHGLQELYQSLRTSPYREHSPLNLENVASVNSSTNSSAILESAPVAAGDLGLIWSPVFSWPSDFPTTTNGAYA